MRLPMQQIFLYLLSLTSSLTTEKRFFYSQVEETKQTIEHIFLFKVKENTDQATIDYLFQELDNLRAIPGVHSLTTGPVNQTYSSSSPSLTFGVFFHSRFGTKEALNAYMNHPQHLKLNHDLTDPLLGDYMLIDWAFHHKEGILPTPQPGSAMRVTFLKLKEGVKLVESEKMEAFKVVGDELGRSVDQYTYGENFATSAKGFSVASLAVFLDVADLEKVGPCEKFAKRLNGKLNYWVEDILVLDYMV
ncbi:hypothetical protein ACHQM5_011800 [Ranunculus cassubicifolius]